MKQKKAENETLCVTWDKKNIEYKCDVCDFISVKKSNLQSHFLTKKHKKTKRKDIFI